MRQISEDGKWTEYSKEYSKQKTKRYKLIKINRLLDLFRLPRPTTFTEKDALGRLFLCLESSKYRGFRASEVLYVPGTLSIPNGILGYQVLFHDINGAKVASAY